jgi:transcriptional regulator with XRE-family HTH domain
MESVGEFFRQVRETKGLTVDEVASKTRIRTDFVKALEEGNFAKLPDQVFARGFVRSYARSLGSTKKMPSIDLRSPPARFMTNRVSANGCGNVRWKRSAVARRTVKPWGLRSPWRSRRWSFCSAVSSPPR